LELVDDDVGGFGGEAGEQRVDGACDWEQRRVGNREVSELAEEVSRQLQLVVRCRFRSSPRVSQPSPPSTVHQRYRVCAYGFERALRVRHFGVSSPWTHSQAGLQKTGVFGNTPQAGDMHKWLTEAGFVPTVHTTGSMEVFQAQKLPVPVG
jgi:hypothetical protein